MSIFPRLGADASKSIAISYPRLLVGRNLCIFLLWIFLNAGFQLIFGLSSLISLVISTILGTLIGFILGDFIEESSRRMFGMRWMRRTWVELRTDKINASANFARRGVGRGDYVILTEPESYQTAILVAALVDDLGAIPILINPHVDLTVFLDTVRETSPKCIVTNLSNLIVVSWFFPAIPTFSMLRSSFLFGIFSHNSNNPKERYESETAKASEDLSSTFLVQYTSGTLSPKPVMITKRTFLSRRDLLSITYPEIFQSENQSVLLVNDWILYLISVGCPMILADTNFSSEYSWSPSHIFFCLDENENHGIAALIGSPAHFHSMALHQDDKHVETKSLRQVKQFIVTGSYMNYPEASKISRLFPDNKKLDIVYGTTEAYPISRISLDNFLNEQMKSSTKQGKGYCIGKPFESEITKIMIAGLSGLDGFSEMLNDDSFGEILVEGDIVSTSYLFKPMSQTHFTGDCGHLDTDGMLWYCGKLADVVADGSGNICPSVCVEAAIDIVIDGNSAFISKSQNSKGVLFLENKKLSDTTVQSVKKALGAMPYEGHIGQIVEFQGQLPRDETYRSKLQRHALRSLV